MDYLKSEAERLPGGTAAKVLSALTLAAIDSDIRNSGSDTPPSVTKLDPDASFATDTVTITISRDDANLFLVVAPLSHRWTVMGRMVDAVQAALEGER
jgi:hypothetical protein